jgi:hypothetical protein
MIDIVGVQVYLVGADLRQGHKSEINHICLAGLKALHLDLRDQDALVGRGEFVDCGDREFVGKLELLVREVACLDVNLLSLGYSRLICIYDKQPAVHEFTCVDVRAVHLHSLLSREEGVYTNR